MQHSVKRTIGRLHSWIARLLDASILSRHWQKLQWNIKYSIGAEQYVPRLESLLNRPHRSHLLAAVDDSGTWQSLLEVGCGRGANLHLLAAQHPEAHLAGVDISPAAIDDARSTLARSGGRVATLAVADAADLKMFANKTFDVVMTDAVTMYMPPTIIEQSLNEMLRVARQGVVISTWHVDLPEKLRKSWIYDDGCWIYDYRRALSKHNELSIDIRPYPAGVWSDQRWLKYGALIQVLHRGTKRSATCEDASVVSCRM